MQLTPVIFQEIRSFVCDVVVPVFEMELNSVLIPISVLRSLF